VADTGAPNTIGVGPGRVYVPWSLKDGETPNRVSAFDAGTGARIWDATLPDDAGDVEAIVADGTRVYVSTWTWLRVLDVSSGELLYTVGRW
jgi:outer membrane protein assembly factor BamB